MLVCVLDDEGIKTGYVATRAPDISSTSASISLVTESENTSGLKEEAGGISYEAVAAAAIGSSAGLLVLANLCHGLGHFLEKKKKKRMARFCRNVGIIASFGSTLLLKAKPTATTTNTPNPCKYIFW